LVETGTALMALSDYVNTFGQYLLRRYGERVHKIAIDAGFTCPNRDGSKGIGGCTFCNNTSFSPNGRQPLPILEQIANGRRVIAKRTRARLFIAYFQAYTSTYADVEQLSALYQQPLSEPDVIGLSIGTRPDCVPEAVLDLLSTYRRRLPPADRHGLQGHPAGARVVFTEMEGLERDRARAASSRPPPRGIRQGFPRQGRRAVQRLSLIVPRSA
jgi:radical SAM superfamily enzyme